MITVSRPINGVTLNGDEWLLDDKKEVMKFQSKKQAKHFLLEAGLEEEEVESLNFHDEE